MFRRRQRAAARSTNRRFRRCRLEWLEARELLSAGPPQVVGVELASTAWSAEFVQYLRDEDLGTDGYAIPVGSAAQSTPLTWANLDIVKIAFSEDVRIEAADLSVSGANAVAYSFSDFHYDPQARVATWTLSTPIDHDRLMLDLNANGLSPVRDLEGYILDGEWTNNSDTYASGNGTAGGDFEFTFNVLPADVNASGHNDYADYYYIAYSEGYAIIDPGYSPYFDIDGSGLIDSADTQQALQRYGGQLPTGLPAGTYNDAPTTKGFGLVRISNTAVDTSIVLTTRFADAESGGGGLAYSIVSNSDPALFDYAYISTSGKLVVNAASSVAGRANITIRATDAGGLITESTVTVDVNYDNVAPSLSLWTEYAGFGAWIISGYVSDPDDDVSTFIIDFWGVFQTRASVDENGYFEFAVILDRGEWGSEYAITADPHGYASNYISFWIGIT
jgi:hypothetical protein